MRGSTREYVDTRRAECDDEGSAPDGRERGGEARPLAVSVILIDEGTVVVDALEWF
jgi:hypothetical protein